MPADHVTVTTDGGDENLDFLVTAQSRKLQVTKRGTTAGGTAVGIGAGFGEEFFQVGRFLMMPGHKVWMYI